MLVPVFTVAENIALQSTGSAVFNACQWAQKVEGWAASLGWKISGHAKIEELSVGEQQRVEILKALFANDGGAARLLLLDEPTANLTPGEVDELFTVLRRLREQNRAVVFVSHKLREVMALCDRVVVLRHGKVVGERRTGETSTGELASLMVGRTLEESAPRTAPAPTDSSRRLRIENLSCGALRNVSLEARGGEIVGIAGVDGNGQRELVEALSGLRPPDSGGFSVEENGVTASGALGLIPADRQRSGLILPFTLAENIALHPAPRARHRKPLRLDWAALRRLTYELIHKFDVRASRAERALASQLSGGNQQKVVIARALSFEPSAVIAADPSRGLDVGATQFTHEQLRRAANSSVPVLLISTDLDEILRLSDRIGVLYEGRLLPEEGLLPAGASRETIGALMGGVSALTPNPSPNPLRGRGVSLLLTLVP
jgi:simple sugar transport system ATP-binding protein